MTIFHKYHLHITFQASFLTTGILSIISVYYVEFIHAFGHSTGTTAWIGSVHMAIHACFGMSITLHHCSKHT